MGTFLSLSAVIGKAPEIVREAIASYIKNNGGNFIEDHAEYEEKTHAVIAGNAQSTTIVYPSRFVEWDKLSQYLSSELQTSVFSCHVHDGDLWMFILFHNGEDVARFNPIPEYWDDVSDEELDYWKGDATEISKYIPDIKPEDMQRYFKHWDMENANEEKAYPDDEYMYGDEWQLLDFLKKFNIAYPFDNDWKHTGKVFKLL
jgi:hypothetical protein